MEASEIAQLACEAGCSMDYLDIGYEGTDCTAMLTRFAALVEAAAMEKAAKIAEGERGSVSMFVTSRDCQEYNSAIKDVAAAIRAAAKKAA